MKIIQLIFRIQVVLYLDKKEELAMCMFCKCNIVKKSTTTHVVNYKGSIIVIKNVPCEECEQCGEKYYTDEVAVHLEAMVTQAAITNK